MSAAARSRGRSRSTKGRPQAPLVGIGRGLSHTLRVRIVISLLGTEAELSSTDLADQLGTSLGNIDYHVKYLLALGLIESKHERHGRGSIQHFYSLVPDVRNLFVAVLEPHHSE
jgi:DNA-binding transcriptional ArsR family regulator